MHFENVLIAIICLACSLIFGSIAIWAFKRKGPMHFWAGSTVKPEEIADIPAYNRANGLMWSVYETCMAASGLLMLFNMAIGVVLLLIVCVPGVAVLVVAYRVIYRKYRSIGPVHENASSKPSTSKPVVMASTVSTLLIVIAVGAMLFFGAKEPVVSIDDKGIRIDAMYGLTVDFAEVDGISLIEESMASIGAGRRTNGFGGFGGTLKGNFNSNELGNILLFVHSDSSPTIRIECRDSKDVYISFKDSEATRALFDEMESAFSR